MDVEVVRDGYKYNLHFEKGENIGGLTKKKTAQKQTGTKTKWKPDLEVFTDINAEDDFFRDVLKRQAVINPNLLFIYRSQNEDGSFSETEYIYENGITDYVNEIANGQNFTSVQFWQTEKKGRDRDDKSEYKVKMSFALTFLIKLKK